MNDWFKEYQYLVTRFSNISSYETAFKPTKWSIRKFRAFVDSIDSRIKGYFLDHTINILKSQTRVRKEFYNFIIAIEKIHHELIKRNVNNVAWNRQIENQLNRGRIEIKKGSEDEIISTLADLRKQQKLNCTSAELAQLLIERFNCKYSYRTILDKINKKNTSII